jgi:hypothetical protein
MFDCMRLLFIKGVGSQTLVLLTIGVINTMQCNGCKDNSGCNNESSNPVHGAPFLPCSSYLFYIHRCANGKHYIVPWKEIHKGKPFCGKIQYKGRNQWYPHIFALPPESDHAGESKKLVQGRKYPEKTSGII